MTGFDRTMEQKQKEFGEEWEKSRILRTWGNVRSRPCLQQSLWPYWCPVPLGESNDQMVRIGSTNGDGQVDANRHRWWTKNLDAPDLLASARSDVLKWR